MKYKVKEKLCNAKKIPYLTKLVVLSSKKIQYVEATRH